MEIAAPGDSGAAGGVSINMGVSYTTLNSCSLATVC